MALSDRLTGKASTMTYAGTTVPLTKWEPKTTRTLASATDSSDYDSASDMVWETQLPAKLAQELSVEGRYNTSVVPSTFTTDLFTGNTYVAVVLTLKSGVIYGHGNYDLSDFSLSSPTEDIVTFTATLKLNGKFTAGS